MWFGLPRKVLGAGCQLGLVVSCLLFGWLGCRTFDPKHPLVGTPEVRTEQANYWLWFEDGKWHLRMTGGGKPHRFQGSLTGLNGGVIDLQITRPELRERIAVVGDSVQFDVDAVGEEENGFEAQVAGSCARFDLLLDGRYRSEHIRLGPRAAPAHHVPFERCP
jgi:hypothetical protein